MQKIAPSQKKFQGEHAPGPPRHVLPWCFSGLAMALKSKVFFQHKILKGKNIQEEFREGLCRTENNSTFTPVEPSFNVFKPACTRLYNTEGSWGYYLSKLWLH